jgi:predicted ATPase
MEGDMPIPARLLSEGTLRVLGLLALNGAKQAPTVIGFEEPENGIHPRRIQAIARLLETRAAGGKTQLIVTTHSPILPNYLPDHSLFVCRKENGATLITPFNCWGPLAKDSAVATALDDSTPVSERIMRGDFDAP